MSGPVLALVALPEDLRSAVGAVASEVWAGQLVATDEVPREAALVVLGGESADDVVRAAVALASAGRVPVLGIARHGARRARSAGLPWPVAWLLGPDELGRRYLGLAIRFALEVGARRHLAEQVTGLRTLADLGMVAGSSAHEINNGLTRLLLDLELARVKAGALRGASPEHAELDGLVSDALDAARHVSRVVADLSRASRPVGRLTSVPAGEVVATARRLCADVLRGVDVRVRIWRNPVIRADERRLTQVLVNLLRNAGLALAGRPAPQIDVSIEQVAEQVVLRVADNGPGLPPAVVQRLFEPFVTTRATGTGLGLALSRGYVQEMGGALAHVPTEQGAAFELRLPLGVEAPLPTLVPDVSLTGVRLLVVDDAELVLRSLARALSTVAAVDTARDGAEARALLAERSYDVVFLDMNLAGLTGRELWHELPRGQKVLFLSGNFTADEQAWLEEQGLPWALKPIGAQEARVAVLELLGRT
jgi:signal transduction histidine kinase